MQIASYPANVLLPFYPAQHGARVAARINVSLTLPRGQLLGELVASPGVYVAYNAGGADGSQNFRGLLEYSAVTDASGNITTIGGAAFGTNFPPQLTVPMFTDGLFRTADLTGDVAGAVAAGRMVVIQGTAANGIVKIGV